MPNISPNHRQVILKNVSPAVVSPDFTPCSGARSSPMDVSAIARTATALSQARVADAAGTLVLKKALDIQAASALQLLQALPTPAPAGSSGTHLIDTYA